MPSLQALLLLLLIFIAGKPSKALECASCAHKTCVEKSESTCKGDVCYAYEKNGYEERGCVTTKEKLFQNSEYALIHNKCGESNGETECICDSGMCNAKEIQKIGPLAKPTGVIKCKQIDTKGRKTTCEGLWCTVTYTKSTVKI